MGETDTTRRAAGNQRPQDGAALRDDADAAGNQVFHLEHRIDRQGQPVGGRDDTHGIGTDQTDAAGSSDGGDLALAFDTVGPAFGEPVTVNGGDGDAFIGALPDDLRNRRRRHHDEGVVDSFGCGREVGGGRYSLDAVAPGVDRRHGAGEPVFDKVALRAPGILGGVVGSPNQGDALRTEQGTGEAVR